MSKTTRKSSKASRVLKAAGTAGIFLGAATLDANVVFAAESDSESFSDSESSILEEESQTEVESIYMSQSTGNGEGVSDSELPAADNAETVESNSESENGSVSGESNSESEQESASGESSSESTENGSASSESNNESEQDSVSGDSGSESEEDSASGESGSDSEEDSEKNSEDEADIESASVSESESAAASESEEASASTSESEAEVASISESESAAASESEEASASTSESEVESLSVSESEAAAISESESTSVSTSESEADSLSALESETIIDKIIAAFVNKSAANLMAETGSVEGQNSELDGLLQEYKDNLTALEKAKAEGNEEEVARLEKAVADSIIKYEAACKGTNADVKDLGNGEYSVTYVDDLGKKVTEFYKSSKDENGNVHVYKANPSYNTGDGSSIGYEISTKEDGFQYININGTDTKILGVQTNEDGTVSYIIERTTNGSGFVTHMKTIVISADKSTATVVNYDVDEKLANQLVDNGDGTTSVKKADVNGEKYDVAGGKDYSEAWFPNGKYVVVQDANGHWHKLILEGGNEYNQLMIHSLYFLCAGSVPV